MFLRRKKRLEVDLAALENDEKELLSDFLRSTLSFNVTLSGSKVSVDSEKLSLEELKKLVNKFVYHKNLNRKYWVAFESGVVKINRFERAKKRAKRKEGIPPSTITHGW